MSLPEFSNNTWLTISLVYTAVCCLLPMVVLGVGAYVAYKQGGSFLNNVILPDTNKMQASYDILKAKYPDKTPDELVQTIIQRQAVRCGAIGALTSIGGLPTLPITLPIDMIASYRIQAGMVNFIARAYEHDTVLPKEEEMVTQLVMFGNSHISDTATTAATKALTSIASDVGTKFLSKLVPFIGAVIGFGVNYLTTQATGQLAANVYSGRVTKVGGGAFQRIGALFRRDKGTSQSIESNADTDDDNVPPKPPSIPT